MKKVIVMLCAAITFAACGDKGSGVVPIREGDPTPNPDEETIDYIESALLPMDKMYWGMHRPSDGGVIKGYVIKPELSVLGGWGADDIFINETEKKIWILNYSRKSLDDKYQLRVIRHYLYSENEEDINNFVVELNTLFNVDIPLNSISGVYPESKNSMIIIVAKELAAIFNYGDNEIKPMVALHISDLSN